MNSQKLTRVYMGAVLASGLACIVSALIDFPLHLLDFQFLLLFILTIGVGSRITIQIPRLKSQIAVSDTFVFLTLLIYGGQVAIILAAVEAFCSSLRFCNKKITVFVNAAAMALSTTAVVFTLKTFGLYSENVLHGRPEYVRNFVVALSVIALTQFVVNTSIASIHDSLKNSTPFVETWKSKYLWIFFTYFVGATGAGILIQLSDNVGFGVVIATFPMIFFLFLSYRMYLKNVEMSIIQAEQAEQYAQTLETQAAALRESEERFRSAFNHAPIGIALVSPEGKWLKVNHALCNILGFAQDELLLTDFQSIIFPEDLGETLVKIHEVNSGKVPSCQSEQRYIHKTGLTVWASWSVSSASDSESDSKNLIFQIQDITGKKLAEERLQHDATHDALTGLPNRSLFMGRLSEALQKTTYRDEYKVSILFIDLDRFKYVNDSLGHLIGDQLLIGISERLRDCVRPSDMVARLGGDEFVVLVEGKYDVKEVIRIAERIQQKFSVAFDLSGYEVYSSASIGILHATENHLTSEDMMRDADTAMYQAKKAGKARHEVFDEKMHEAAKETLRLETDLRRAVEKEEITVFYQPLYSLDTGEIEGVEALARWQHSVLGEVSPRKFIDLAEEIGLIDNLGDIVLRRACTEIGSLQREGSNISLNVNLSCRQFSQTSLVKSIEKILDETEFSPRRLRLEITESVFFEFQQRAINTLNELRKLGIEMSVDDFGTGYSSLGYLVDLPISSLKIDRSFVRMLDQADGNSAIVQSIVMLAKNLGLKVAAEGVETNAQLEELKKLGCDGAQGYLFAKPMSFDEIKEFLVENTAIPPPPMNFDEVSHVEVLQ